MYTQLSVPPLLVYAHWYTSSKSYYTQLSTPMQYDSLIDLHTIIALSEV